MSVLFALMLSLPLIMLLLLGVKPMQLRVVRLLVLAPLPGLVLALASGWEMSWTLRLGGWAFEIDRPGALLLGAAALIWSLAGACASHGLKGCPGAPRFAFWWLLTLWGSLGVFVAADMVSFYVLYAAASLPAYGLIVWEGGVAERWAGKLTLAAALLGEAFLLAAIVLLAAGSPGQTMLIRDAVTALVVSPFRDAVIALVILSFGFKIGLVPLHGWMPLSYASGPLFAVAALSGATSKAGLIGMIRFLPFDAAYEGWGMFLLVFGLVSAFYGVAIGLLQSNPRSVLAYSSVSQFGQMAATLGAGLAAGTAGVALMVSFYAFYHVLVKGGLFLATDALTNIRHGLMRRLILVTAAIAALGFAGLPLAGGALAKLAIKPVVGEGLSGLLFAFTACGSTLLMLQFIRLIRNLPAATEGQAGQSTPAYAWLFIFIVAMLGPWLLFAGVTGLSPGYAIQSAVILELGWPIVLGLLMGWGFSVMGLRPSAHPSNGVVTRGDVVMNFTSEMAHVATQTVDRLATVERASRPWPVSSSLLVFIMLMFTILLALKAG